VQEERPDPIACYSLRLRTRGQLFCPKKVVHGTSSNKPSSPAKRIIARLSVWCYITKPHHIGICMSRLTITLDDELHRALKETAARQHRSIGSIIEESLRLRGIRTYDSARDIVARARSNSGLSADEALTLAVSETRRARKQKQSSGK